MSTITLPNIRVSSDLTVKVRLKDGGVAIDWSTLSNIRALIYADAQRAMAGRCTVSIDAEDATLLVCQYAANKPQYIGVNRIVISATYMGEMKTYDKPALNFVRWTDDQAGQEITIDDPDVEVEIEVEDVSSSILQEAVDAAFSAAERAENAAEAAEHMVDIHTGPEGKSAYEVAVDEGYTGTEEEWLASLKGDTGETPDITIGTVTTVEPGTPAAATMTGTPEAPVLNLTIPQGAVGATPNFTVGEVTTGEPGTSVVVTITGTAAAPVLNVTIPQGMQGNTGSSVEYPYELVNNLTTNDATKGLSAAQGKVLKDEVDQLEHELGDFSEYDQQGYVPVSVTPRTGYYFYFTTLDEVASAPYEYATLAVQPGEKYRISGYNGNSNIPLAIARLSGTNTKVRAISQSSASALSGEYTIPEGYDTLYVNGLTATAPVVIEKWTVVPGSAKKAIDDVKGDISDIEDEIQDIKDEIGDVSQLDTMGYVPLTPTIIQDYYFYNPDSAPVASAGYSYTRIPCTPGDKFLVTGYSPNTNIALATAFKENTLGGKSVLVAGGGKLVDIPVTIPDGPFDELIVNGHTLQPIEVKKYGTIEHTIVDFALDVDAKVGDGDVSAITGEKSETGTKTSGKYIQLDLTKVASADYEFVELAVSPGEKYYIEGWNLNSNIPLSIFAKSGTSTSTRGLYASTSKGLNGIVTVPEGYDTLYVNGNTVQGTPVVIRKQLVATDLTEAVGLLNDIPQNIKDSFCPIFVKMNELASVGDYNGADIYIIKRFNEDYDIFWKFQNKMDNPNKFFDFRSAGIVPRGDGKIQDFICISNRTDIVGSTSDYILPLVVGATSNKNGDFPDNTSYFTGGAHGYGNSSSSEVSATMREISRSILLDGIPIVNGDRKYGDVLQIDVINNIQGCNTEKSNGTGREIIQQHIRVVLDRENVNVEVEFTALEEVNIYALNGLGQYFNYGNVRFIGSTTKRGVYVAGQRAVTEDKHTNTIRCFGTDYYFDLTMDRTFGLAQDGGLADYNAMGTIANKGYFNLVGETPLTLQSGEMVSFRGSFALGMVPVTE